MRPWQRTLRDVDAAVVEAAFAFQWPKLGEGGEAPVPSLLPADGLEQQRPAGDGLAMMMGFGQAHERLIAISALTPLWPFSSSDRVTRETPGHFAAAVTERSRGFRQSSRMISPGW